MTGLAGKVALITGAAGGQGRAAALALAREGVHITGFDIAKALPYPGYALGTEEGLTSLQEECGKLGVTCLVFAGDVRDDAALSRAVDETIARLGSPRRNAKGVSRARTQIEAGPPAV